MLAKDAASCAHADGAALLVAGAVEDAEDVAGAAGDQDLLADAEERAEAGPLAADDRDAAGGGLEQADAGRPAGAHHLRPGDVQREARRVGELAQLARW